MRRAAFIGGSILSAALWLALGFGLARLVYAYIDVDIPLWLADAIRAFLIWLDPHYSPDALDIIDSCLFLLLVASLAVSAILVVPLSVIAWRRYMRARSQCR